MKDKTEKYLKRFFQLLFLITILILAVVYGKVGVNAQSLSKTIDGYAHWWYPEGDATDVHRTPSNEILWTSITNDFNGGTELSSWTGQDNRVPIPLTTTKNINGTYSNAFVKQYDMLTLNGVVCSSNCDVDVDFHILWYYYVSNNASNKEAMQSLNISYIIEQYNNVFLNFTDLNSQNWSVKLGTRVANAYTFANSYGMTYALDIEYSLTIYNVHTIDTYSLFIDDINSFWTQSQTLNVVISPELVLGSFDYTTGAYTGGTNGTGGTDEDDDTLIEQQQQMNEKLEDIYSQMLDESNPNMSGLGGSAGWLPAGPVDSVLNLPLSFFNGLNNALSTTCSPVNVPIPFVSQNVVLPCMNTLFNQINGFNTWWTAMGLIASAFILYKYLLHLYKWVDDTLTFRENNWQDWGGI